MKPSLPRSIRWGLRPIRIPGIIKRYAGVWPIDDTAGAKPSGWNGRPHGKQFALVFTHDVESEEGLRLLRALAELEMSHGLLSSFNFIPEGSYRNPVRIRKWLETNGFEIGVHDLNHDGHLYESRETFSRKAESIKGCSGILWHAILRNGTGINPSYGKIPRKAHPLDFMRS